MERRRRFLWRKLAAAGAVVVLGTAAGVGAAMAEASSSDGYRTAVATTGDATRTLTVTGSVQPVSQAQASFQVPGTVSAVSVSVGQQVTAGQTLATLDAISLSQQVSVDQANLATAQAKLAQDESGQSSSGSAQAASVVTSGQTAVLTSVLTAVGSGSGSGSGSLAQAQQAVVSAQHTADLDIQASAAALASAQSACGTSGSGKPPSGQGGSGGTPSTTTTSTTTPTTTTTSTTTTSTTGPGPTDASACSTALQQAYAAEQQVSKDQQAVQTAEQALAKILSSQASAGSGSSSSGTKSPSSPVSTTATDSAAQLATDQASIDNDEASLVSAEQALGNATLTAPIGGVIAAIDLAPGQAVTANSSSHFITVTGPGSFETVSSLTTSQVSQVATGDAAAIMVDGQSEMLEGTVTKVGPVSVSGSSYTYPVVVSLNAGPGATALVGGSAAQVQIQVAHATGTLVVPTSAVHSTAPGRAYVMVLRGGKEVRTTVRTGVIGQLFTQITSGISAGTVVVLADPSQAVPSSSANSTGLGGRAAFFGVGGAGVGRVVIGGGPGGGSTKGGGG
jgi:multidrug efflux pump subunit AcrA (membrane-fusion protein)